MAVYERTYELTSCHFNGESVYKDYYEAQEAAKAGDFTKAYALLLAVLPASHGHNFKVKITATGLIDIKTGYVIDDYELEKMIRKYDNVNLSTLEEFGGAGVRATTENLAVTFWHMIKECFPKCRVQVDVWETEQICARYGDSVE
jgi:6-pyruvoyl-tetrahydropterin synthase